MSLIRKGYDGGVVCACGDHAFARTTRHGVVLVDVADKGHLDRPWTMMPTGYAFAKDGGNQTILLHRVIAAAPKGKVVDHANRDKLDNRSRNLRLCSIAQNSWNSVAKSDHAKGLCRRDDKWTARIRVGGRRLNLGTFLTEEEAARAYDTAAITHHGEFARLNFGGR